MSPALRGRGDLLVNFAWSMRSVERALEASGFEKISWAPLAADGAPDDTGESYEELVGVFTALLA